MSPKVAGGTKFRDAFLAIEDDISGPRNRENVIYAAAESSAVVNRTGVRATLERELFDQVIAVIGRDISANGGLQYLYHRNPELSRQMLFNAHDRLKAALYLLDGRSVAKGAAATGLCKLFARTS
ncbi:MAG: hypothetical protein R3C46_14870 [Hyphomonadaceae bacterium]